MIARTKIMKGGDIGTGHVLYWMQQSQRAEWNHALEHAIDIANENKRSVHVIFCLTPEYLGANLRHYTFMLEGLTETANRLKDRGVGFEIVVGDVVGSVVKAAKDAGLLVMDMGYTRKQRQWRELITGLVDIPVHTVESDIIVPVRYASNKEEYAARTIRPKIHAQLGLHLQPIEIHHPDTRSEVTPSKSPMDLLEELSIDRTVRPSPIFRGGRLSALERLNRFIYHGLYCYDDKSNDPNSGCISDLSPYLHFGQISPVEIALRVQKIEDFCDDFLEQLIVRRELAINYCYYNRDHDSLKGIHENWARQTMEAHLHDTRDYIYTPGEFETARTHDPAWNAAQMEMVKTGKMHNYMRMYWGKKAIEWTNSYEEAHRILVHLNDKYELDGRDANAYTGIAWLFGKHDRAWTERPVFGKLRYMNYNGLKRKFDVGKYVGRWT